MTDFRGRPWVDKVLSDVRAKHPHGETLGPLQFKVPIDFVRAIDAAAHKRSLSRTGYVRRALAVMVAADLSMEVRDLLRILPNPLTRGAAPRTPRTADDGEGIEDWCPHPGCDGRHLIA